MVYTIGHKFQLVAVVVVSGEPTLSSYETQAEDLMQGAV